MKTVPVAVLIDFSVYPPLRPSSPRQARRGLQSVIWELMAPIPSTLNIYSPQLWSGDGWKESRTLFSRLGTTAKVFSSPVNTASVYLPRGAK